MAEHFQRKWFESQLRFRFPGGAEEETVFIGNADFSPVEVLRESARTYDQEFNYWLYEDWKPRQEGLRQQILNFDGNANRYLDLKERFGRQQVVPLIGSGMSVPSGLPTWSDFLKEVGKSAQCDLSELEQLICSSDFEGAVDLLAKSMASRLLAERVSHKLRINSPDIVDGPVCLLPSLFPNLVITTNLDNVLEHVYQVCGVSFAYALSGKRLRDYRQLKNPDERFLLKLHGDYQSQEGRVLLSSEYEEAYASNSSLREEITLLYRQNSLLFLGCSLGADRTVQLIREVANSDANMPSHYAFLTKPNSDDDRIARENSLVEGGIFPIWYDWQHDEAIMALLDGLSLEDTQY